MSVTLLSEGGFCKNQPRCPQEHKAKAHKTHTHTHTSKMFIFRLPSPGNVNVNGCLSVYVSPGHLATHAGHSLPLTGSPPITRSGEL